MGPTFSHGLITSAAPTFSMRSERFDSQVCSYLLGKRSRDVKLDPSVNAIFREH